MKRTTLLPVRAKEIMGADELNRLKLQDVQSTALNGICTVVTMKCQHWSYLERVVTAVDVASETHESAILGKRWSSLSQLFCFLR